MKSHLRAPPPKSNKGVDSWLAWKLSGGKHHVTDVTNASRTLLLNLSGEWDDWMLQLLRIPREVLPRVLPSSFDAGIRWRTSSMFSTEKRPWTEQCPR
ncbi:MAG: hypothetical protein EBS52_04395, partial [Betaproteobacteria bacterium]|nr:hypothetical protein [Betaproteobacteria bacterium]